MQPSTASSPMMTASNIAFDYEAFWEVCHGPITHSKPIIEGRHVDEGCHESISQGKQITDAESHASNMPVTPSSHSRNNKAKAVVALWCSRIKQGGQLSHRSRRQRSQTNRRQRSHQQSRRRRKESQAAAAVVRGQQVQSLSF